GTDHDQVARFSILLFHADHIGGGNGHFRVHVAVLAHPAVVVNLAEVAIAGIGQESDDEVALLAIFGQAQRSGNAAAARATGKDPCFFREAAGPDETFLVVHLDHFVHDLQVHGTGEKVFADAFHDVGGGFSDGAIFHEFVVKRADGIHADDFDFWIFFFQ